MVKYNEISFTYAGNLNNNWNNFRRRYCLKLTVGQHLKLRLIRKAETERAIFVVQADANKYKKIENIDFELYEVFNDNNNSLGYALPYEGNGFQGKIRLIVGINKDLTNLYGLEVLEQVETPGLGTKVTETSFTNQFKNLLVTPEIISVKGVTTTKSK